jgi:hypothetical protein
VGQELGGTQDFAVVELHQRLLRQGDLGDLEAREVRRCLRHVAQHGGRHGLEHRVRRRRQHADADPTAHLGASTNPGACAGVPV